MLETNLSSPVIQMPKKPSWKRYKAIFLDNMAISVYRALEYEALSSIDYSGRVLDFGGGNNAHYYPMLRSRMFSGSYESVNILGEMDPTYHVSPDVALPIDRDTYDMVLSVNTLEHVYELENTLKELIRVLKSDGKLILAVPFLYRMHGCPDDFNRPTASWWGAKLSQLGVKDIKITPLVWDVMTTGFSVTEGAGPFGKIRKLLVPLYGLLYATIRVRGPGERYPETIGQQLSNFALGYIITGTK